MTDGPALTTSPAGGGQIAAVANESRRLVGAEPAKDLQPRIDVGIGVVVGTARELGTTHRAESRTIGPAQRRDRFFQHDRLAHGLAELELVVVGEPERIRLGRNVQACAGDRIERGQCLLLQVDGDRDLDLLQAAAALRLQARLEPAGDQEPTIGPDDVNRSLEGVGLAEIVAQVEHDPGDRKGAAGAGALGEQASDVERQLAARVALPHGRTASAAAPSSLKSKSPASPSLAPPSTTSSAARRSSRRAIPFLMLCSVRTTSPSRPMRTAAAYSSAPRRTSSPSPWAWATILRLSSSAAWVSPRSSIRKAACSCARATTRSASCWAFSMIRSPWELIRLAA